MSKHDLTGKSVAFLVTDGFEQIELTEPWKAVSSAGGKPKLVSPKSDKVQGVHHEKPGDQFDVDVKIGQANADDFDALVLPGGVFNPDALRTNAQAVDFVKAFFAAGKPVATICHGPWMLVEADVVEDRQVTSWPSLKTDLLNAGAQWIDEECVCDNGLVTSRKPDDLPVFCAKMVEEIAEGVHA